ncbi:nicotinamide-nucleotide amidohydrolase pncc [Anaeramoeba flamelloides]|uniref:Nicotinamide-nucleotide amidohydrolase pncc n=1 Tax=Anaeramoeba flamelloides TaxID=1746091 RepID=A0AAV7Z1W3_9EUKA|nr:nicotinamide-nucleotide amidohydrolase pncc [Anaeramoeba flamelloides]|eukprot:Anaeramoba_flamelloidesa325529_242.p1 GENE.a325529_242~~a325529_242.p1  ORF type:complete len:286 (-),score=34.63 a325529_242:97-900(-)
MICNFNTTSLKSFQKHYYCRNFSKAVKQLTASGIVIGDEILNGSTRDSNMHDLCKTMYKRGVNLSEVRVIGDVHEQIKETVEEMSQKTDFVFTTGGIGPTHDDITYESIASAFGLKTKLHNGTWEDLKKWYAKRKISYDSRAKSMALFPDPCKLVPVKGLITPVVNVNNVYILAGVPSVFRLMLESTVQYLDLQVKKLWVQTVSTKKREVEFSRQLEQIQSNFPQVKIGSYPKWLTEKNSFKVFIRIEAPDENLGLKVTNLIRQQIL